MERYFTRNFYQNEVLKGQGSGPHITQFPDSPGERPLFYSRREQALLSDFQIEKGYGFLPKGVLLAKNTATDNYVPYAAVGSTMWKSAAVSDIANGASTIQILKEEAYIFQVGFSIVLERSGPEYHDGGAITAVDMTSSDVFATVTFTNATTDANFTVANGAQCYIKAGTSGKFSEAVLVLDKAVDSGWGQYAVGAQCSALVSNAMLYEANIWNLDADAKTSLPAKSVGRFLTIT